MTYLTKLKGAPAPVPPRPPLRELGFIAGGALIASLFIGYLAHATGQPLIMGSFGASIFVLFVVPESPFAQPRNVIAAHCLTTFIGLGFYHWVSPDWWSMAIALTVAITLIQFLRVPHPPAGSNPVIVFLSGVGWDFLLMPALIGAVILVVIAAFYNNLARDRSYPKYW